MKEIYKEKNIKYKITFFSPNLAGGGAERIIAILAAHFSEKKYDVDLVLANATGPYLVSIPDSVRIIDLQCKRVFFSLPGLIKYLKVEQPNVLFTSQMHSSTIALWAVKLASVDTSVFIRQPTMLMPYYENKSLTSIFRQKLFLETARLAKKVIVTSEAMAEEFQALSKVSKDKVEVIYNPVPVDAIQEKSSEPIEHLWFKEGEPPVILAVGRLVAVKDFKTLIRAFDIAQKKIPCRLIILGEGTLRSELEQLVEKLDLSELVQLQGFVNNPYQYMKHSKVFVLSSLWEGFPNGMVEAMACGMAIVATDCEGGASEILEYGKWGELIPVGNEELMAQAIVKSIISEKKPNTFERVKDFSVDVTFKKYYKVFNK